MYDSCVSLVDNSSLCEGGFFFFNFLYIINEDQTQVLILSWQAHHWHHYHPSPSQLHSIWVFSVIWFCKNDAVLLLTKLSHMYSINWWAFVRKFHVLGISLNTRVKIWVKVPRLCSLGGRDTKKETTTYRMVCFLLKAHTEWLLH